MVSQNPQFSLSDVRASVCRDSFYDFVQQFWSESIPEEPVWNWHIEYICKEMQKVAELVFNGIPKEYDLVINVPPGSTKSTICSIMFPAWVWSRMPTARIIGGSYAKDLSMELSRRNRDVVQSELYQETFPHIQLRQDQNVKTHFVTEQGGGRLAVGVGGAVTGFHAHFLLVDDPLNPQEAVSEAELKTANTWMGETLSQRKVDKAITPTILIMQRLHQNDPTASMIERAKDAQKTSIDTGEQNAKLQIKHICLPGEKTKDIKPMKARRFYKDGLLDPKRLSKKILNSAMAELGEYGYAGQILQNPIPRGGGMFKTDRIKLDIAPTKWLDLVRFWDKAGTEDGGKYSVGVKLGLDRNKHLWILDVVRGRWSSEVRESIIKQTAQTDTIKVIVGIEQEPGSGGKESAESTIKNLMGFRVKKDKPSGSHSSKIQRADPFSVQVNAGNVSMVQGEWNSAFLNEMMFWPNSTFLDQGDAASGAFNMLMKGGKKKGPLWTRTR